MSLSASVGASTKDAVWRELVLRCRGIDREVWTVAAIGLMLPGLRRAAAQVTRGHGWQPTLLLDVCAVVGDQRGRYEVGVEDAGEGHPPEGDLLDDARVGHDVEPQAAVFDGDPQGGLAKD